MKERQREPNGKVERENGIVRDRDGHAENRVGKGTKSEKGNEGKRKRGGTRNAGIDSRRQPATSLKHTTESTRLHDSETRFTTATYQ